MNVTKSIIMSMALDGVIKVFHAEEEFVHSSEFAWISYAFTRDCPVWKREEIEKFISKGAELLGIEEFVSEQPINTVTRRSKLWDK